MAPTIYLHIGIPKTGSGSLQHFLKKNQQALSKRGCLFPMTGRGRYDHHSQFRFAATGLDYVFYYLFLRWKKYPDWYLRSPGLKQSRLSLLKEIEASGASSVVISSEWFSMGMFSGAIRRLSGLFEGFQTRPVMYIRRQDEAIQSFYAELIKNPFTRFSFDFNPGLMKFVPFFDYYREYQRWAEVFGHNNVIVRCYDQLLERDINRDFLELLRIEPEGLELSTARKNPHLNSAQIHALKRANRQQLSESEYRNMLNEHESRQPSSGFDLLSESQAASIRRHFADSNRRLAQTAFAREWLFLDDFS